MKIILKIDDRQCEQIARALGQELALKLALPREQIAGAIREALERINIIPED